MTRQPTSRDVARLAGVAQATVSHVLTGRVNVAPATRARVLQAIDELGYRPNLAARSMRTRRTGRLAVVLGVVMYRATDVLSGAGAAARDAGYVLEVHDAGPSVASCTERVVELARSGSFEGVAVYAPVEADAVADGALPCPVVVSDEFDARTRPAGSFTDASAVRTLVERLAAAGYRRFLHVGGPGDHAAARSRRRAYLEAVDALGLESLGVVEGDWGGRAGYAAVRDVPASARPLALVAANDLLAAGAVRAARERGWAVPGDLGVSGWDDMDMGRFMTPSLTTVAVDRVGIGRRGVRRLVAEIDGAEPDRSDVGVMTVVWRESTGDASAS
ncbi:LacI family DNA-binding transcriptional regulator [Cellulomonas iranensis]|uniref:LacI family DNA-binding transcriptional regulator n=1 Tax=Cellulomonas iranensis TaxID=76862 RepID=UPI000B3CE424|nr:LacI family DNA-binding transcriptional regulator [Cellulomonas iranensis]